MSFRSRCAGAACLAALAILLPIPWGCQGTCTQSSECADTDFCSIANGICLTAKSAGFCKAKPDSCADVLALVCGCDGKTYNNSCEASLAGVSVAAAGACGASCGGVTATQCPKGEFCDLGPGTCGAANPSGVCRTPPADCATVDSPVCGCDHKTYTSQCDAAKAGVSIFAAGECSCGGPEATPCEMGRYCAFGPGLCLGADPLGQCKLPPTDCTSVKSPVCGCDGVVYENSCLAAKALVSVTGTLTCTKVMTDAGADGGDAGDAGVPE